MIFISTILGTGALVLGSTLLASCSKSVVETNLNSYAQDSNQQSDVDFVTDTHTHTHQLLIQTLLVLQMKQKHQIC